MKALLPIVLRLFLPGMILFAGTAPSIQAQDLVLPLWPADSIPGQTCKTVEEHTKTDVLHIRRVSEPVITVFLPSPSMATHQAVVICPGGGYSNLAFDKEGTDVAGWLNSIGIAGIVLKYRLPDPSCQDEPHRIPLLDAQRAIRLTRQHAAEWNIDPDRVGIMGFSAGGHLAATAGTHFDSGDPGAGDEVERWSSRPSFLVLVYPVISFTEYVHTGSRERLLGRDPDSSLCRYYSAEKMVRPDTPPSFIVHASDDKGVFPQNSILFYQALLRNNIPA